jgi:hypothetical protein
VFGWETDTRSSHGKGGGVRCRPTEKFKHLGAWAVKGSGGVVVVSGPALCGKKQALSPMDYCTG